MTKLLKILTAISLLSIFACQSNDPNHIAQENLKDELMVVHDEVMPKMGEIHKLKKQLKKLSTESSVEENGNLEEIKNAIYALEKADDGMMDWMANFKSPSKLRGEKSHEEIMAYLENEKEKIEQVKNDMMTSIERAKKLVEIHSTAE
ncbi:MAG: hypothetical protein R2825_07665 [Saprospiraceae bacterium]